MSRPRVRMVAAVLTVVVVLALGLAWVNRSDTTYASSARLGPVPATSETLRRGIDLDRADTIGTFMQLVRAQSTLREANAGDVQVSTAIDEGTTVFSVTATGADPGVQAALERVIAVAQRRQTELRDVYRIQVVTAPGPAGVVSTRPELLILLVSFFALLAGTLVLVVPGRLAGGGDAWTLGRARRELTFEASLLRIGPLTDSTSLLRVEGRWLDEEERPLAMPSLVIGDGDREVEIPPARTPGARPPLAGPEPEAWEGAYGIPAVLFDRVGPPALALKLPEGRFPVEFEPSVWRRAAPGYEAPLASTSS